jgi:hypothetical protein
MEIMAVVASCSWTMPLYGISTVYMVMMTDERCQVIVIIAADDPPRSDTMESARLARQPTVQTCCCSGEGRPACRLAGTMLPPLTSCCHTRQDNTVGKL